MEPGLLKSADWPLLIDIYFFLGGVAGGAFVLATIAALIDGRRYRDLVRVGYYLALLAIIPGPLILIIDLGLPSRFLHMLMVTGPRSTDIGAGAITLGPLQFKARSPMNVGAWALLIFSGCAFLAALLTYLEDRGRRISGATRVLIGLIGSFFGFFIAAYPGVLLGATARPLFISAHWLGALFLIVGASTAAAAIALVLSVLGNVHRDSILRLMKITVFALILEVVGLVLFFISVSSTGSVGVAQALGPLLTGSHSLLFWLGAVLIGLAIPLALQFGAAARRATPGFAALVAILVLVGGFVFKYVIIAAGQKMLS
jgi:formate-dependent nitrite reductase membrane component NrfD